ncbi:MAG: hypothetical protein IPL12_16835 [Bacteroidetes bacterium]|nr:hypothetical protein [Bacteroidota bacterium]
MIVYWMRKNGNCYFREQIQENYKYYSNIMEDSVLLDQTEIKFILESGTLNDELNELNQVCKYYQLNKSGLILPVANLVYLRIIMLTHDYFEPASQLLYAKTI